MAGSQRGARFVDAGRPPRKDQCKRIELTHAGSRDVVTDNLGIRVPLADPPRDELDVLGPEIENEHGTCRRAEIRHGLPLKRD